MKTIHIIVALLFLTQLSIAQQNIKQMEKNKELVRVGFEKWATGSGSFFDLLDDDAHWTISGSSYLSKTYISKKQLADEVLNPLNDRLSQKIIPTVRALFADGNTVIAIWDGKATDLMGHFRTNFLSKDSVLAPKNPIDDYLEVRQSQAAHQNEIDGNQPGDPDKAIDVLIEMSKEQNPPLHLFLGQDAYDISKNKLEEVSEELEQWKSYTLSTGF
jgi:ketosteroid isomerase-like protein